MMKDRGCGEARNQADDASHRGNRYGLPGYQREEESFAESKSLEH
jgi:hypothetical protein